MEWFTTSMFSIFDSTWKWIYTHCQLFFFIPRALFGFHIMSNRYALMKILNHTTIMLSMCVCVCVCYPLLSIRLSDFDVSILLHSLLPPLETEWNTLFAWLHRNILFTAPIFRELWQLHACEKCQPTYYTKSLKKLTLKWPFSNYFISFPFRKTINHYIKFFNSWNVYDLSMLNNRKWFEHDIWCDLKRQTLYVCGGLDVKTVQR